MRKNDYIKTMQKIHMPDDMRTRILHRMAQENTKEVPFHMMRRNKKKMAAVLVAVAMAVGGSAFAFSGTISSIFSSSSSDRITPACRVRSSVSGMPVLHRLCYRALIMALHSKTA